jgi:putative transcription factor
MEFQDWNVVTFDKRSQKQPAASVKSSQLGVTKPRKTSLNENKIFRNDNIKNIENEEDTFVIKKVSLSVAKKIAQARCEKKLTQKELAFKLSLPLKTINDYESSKAVPNDMILSKIEKILGTRVRETR